jgi:hypothetical protein
VLPQGAKEEAQRQHQPRERLSQWERLSQKATIKYSAEENHGSRRRLRQGKGYPHPRSRMPPRRSVLKRLANGKDWDFWYEGKCILCGSQEHLQQQRRLWDESQQRQETRPTSAREIASTLTSGGMVRLLPPPPM